MFEHLSKANTTQRAVLILVILSSLFASVLTWDMVIHRAITREAAGWTAAFISRFGAFGLLVSFGITLTIFIPCWLGWVWLSRESGVKGRRFIALCASVGGCMVVFVLALLDLANDLLVFGFGSDVLLPFLTSHLALVPMLLAFALAVSQIYLKLNTAGGKRG